MSVPHPAPKCAAGTCVDIPGVILAGGRGRRMGGIDKGLVKLDGLTLVEHATARLADQVPILAINANGDPGRYTRTGLPQLTNLKVLPDPVAGYPGPLAGVLAGLEWAAGIGATAIVTVATDTPFFPVDLVARLAGAAARRGADPSSPGIALAATRDIEGKISFHPTFGHWPVCLRDDLRRALDDGTRKIRQWTDRHGAVAVEFAACGNDPFFNINTMEDLRQAKAMATAAWARA